MPVQQASRKGPFYLATGKRRLDLVNRRTTLDAVRSPMLMPLLVWLTDSEIKVVDGVVAQVSDGVENDGGVLEEVGSAGLPIDQKPLLPDLYIEPVHRDAQLGCQLGRGE